METPELLKEIEKLVGSHHRKPDWLQQTFAVLGKARPHYEWVGLYLLEGEELALACSTRAPATHARIPVRKGISGAAVREKKTVIVPDVGADPRYLAGNPETRSEIVVPLESEGRILGALAVDSTTLNAFGADDHQLLEQVVRRLALALTPAEKHA